VGLCQAPYCHPGESSEPWRGWQVGLVGRTTSEISAGREPNCNGQTLIVR
jgi:hypothetical protein